MQHLITGLSWPKSGVTPSSVIRAAWSILISTYTDTDEVIFGAVASGRQLPVLDIDRVAGPTISTVPILVKVNHKSTVYELQISVQDQALEMTPFEQTGLQQIRKLSAELERACDFQTLLVIQSHKESVRHSDKAKLFARDIDAEEMENAEDTLNSFSTYVLTLLCDINENGLNVRFNFDSRIMQQAEVKRLAQQLEHVIRWTSREETIKVEDIRIVSDEDIQQIWNWNATALEPVKRCVHDIFAETVQKLPNAPAIYGKNGQQTYQELT